jgi:large conductance mechanosensitive channel
MPSSKKFKVSKPDVKKVTKKVTSKIEAAPKAIASVGGSQLKGFIDFIRTQGVVGLAIGLVLGGAVSTLVKSLIDNVVMPPLGMLLGSAEGIKGLAITIGTTAAGKPAILNYGVFLNDFINFIIIALVVYLIVHLLKLDRLDKKKD